MKNEDVKNIDVWLTSLSKESIEKILTVINVLRSISELTESSFFTVPYEAFQKAGLDDTIMETILTKLWRKGIINLMDCDDEHHSASDWNKEFDPDNSFNDDMGIKLNLDAFKYLYRALVNNRERFFMVPEGSEKFNMFLSGTENKSGFEGWIWIDRNKAEYQFGQKKFVQHGIIRKKVFVAFMDGYEKNHQAIPILTISKKTGLKAGRIRIEIGGINKRLAPQIGYFFKGSGKGYYTLEKTIIHKST